MASDLLAALPARCGHYLLESGYHTDIWLTLDAVFVDSAEIAPLVAALADKIRAHSPSAICGPLRGGAFLAQALAATLGARFYYTEPAPAPPASGLFTAEYRLPSEQRRRISGEQVCVVDDLVSAGSSVRATIAAITAAGASTVVVGTFMVLGETAVDHFASEHVPLEALARRAFNLWKPADCPLCRQESPMSSSLA